MYGRQQSGPALTLELHDDAADVRRIRYAQKYLALYEIQISVVLMRMLQHDADNHVGRPDALGLGYNVLCWADGNSQPL